MTIALNLLWTHQTHLKIAIIGAAGIVGTAVSQTALDQGHTVLALDRPLHGNIESRAGYEYRPFNALDYGTMKEVLRGCDALVHLAAVYNAHDDDGHLLDDAFTQNVSLVLVLWSIENEEWPRYHGRVTSFR